MKGSGKDVFPDNIYKTSSVKSSLFQKFCLTRFINKLRVFRMISLPFGHPSLSRRDFWFKYFPPPLQGGSISVRTLNSFSYSQSNLLNYSLSSINLWLYSKTTWLIYNNYINCWFDFRYSMIHGLFQGVIFYKWATIMKKSVPTNIRGTFFLLGIEVN